jgi:hypothetical protein
MVAASCEVDVGRKTMTLSSVRRQSWSMASSEPNDDRTRSIRERSNCPSRVTSKLPSVSKTTADLSHPPNGVDMKLEGKVQVITRW